MIHLKNVKDIYTDLQGQQWQGKNLKRLWELRAKYIILRVLFPGGRIEMWSQRYTGSTPCLLTRGRNSLSLSPSLSQSLPPSFPNCLPDVFHLCLHLTPVSTHAYKLAFSGVFVSVFCIDGSCRASLAFGFWIGKKKERFLGVLIQMSCLLWWLNDVLMAPEQIKIVYIYINVIVSNLIIFNYVRRWDSKEGVEDVDHLAKQRDGAGKDWEGSSGWLGIVKEMF